MKKQLVTADAPSAVHMLSQAVVSNGFIYVAGQLHCKPDGTMVEGSVEEKVAQIMLNITAILKVAQANLDDIVKVVIYVTDMAQMPTLNSVYPSYFSEPYPAREAVCVKELPFAATIEISVVAAQ